MTRSICTCKKCCPPPTREPFTEAEIKAAEAKVIAESDLLRKNMAKLREAASALVSECDGLYISDVTGRMTGKGVSAQAIRDVEVARKKMIAVLKETE